MRKKLVINLPIITALIAILCVTLINVSNAEPVLIKSGARTFGQGWLFGSPKDASCWLATPRHVIESSRDGELKDFQFSDLKGVEGIGINPIIPRKGLDLAFAKVSGRATGSCLSRLGSDDISFTIRRQPNVEAMKMQSTHTSPKKMAVRDFNKDFVIFAPSDEIASNAMKPGLSGAPIIFRSNDGRDIPVGLVNTINKDKKSGHAVRFDVIKQLFLNLAIPADTVGSDGNTEASSQTLTVRDVTGISADADSSVSAALTRAGCWIARPPEGKRSFSAIIAPSSAATYHSLIVSFDIKCGEKPDGLILEKPKGKGWTTFSSCKFADAHASCTITGQSIDQLRLTVISRSGEPKAIRQLQFTD